MHMLVPAPTLPFQPVLGVMRTAGACGVAASPGTSGWATGADGERQDLRFRKKLGLTIKLNERGVSKFWESLQVSQPAAVGTGTNEAA
jgi:hypothetical protein